MSSQKGNLRKTGGQKHQNRTSFRNNLHDTSGKTKKINSVVAAGVCHRCKDAIDWKIQYKKYKPLTQPRSCNKCHQKTIKQAYYTICIPCAQAIKVCQKCGENKEIAIQPGLSADEQASLDTQLKFELNRLSERQRRTFFRLQNSGKLTSVIPSQVDSPADCRTNDDLSNLQNEENTDSDESQSECDSNPLVLGESHI